MIGRRTSMICLFLALPVLAVAKEAAPSVPPAIARQIDGDIQAFLRQHDVAGATIAIYDHGTPIYKHAYGLRSRAGQLPVRTDTPFEIGSITKQFTAAAILQLKEASKLDIDAPLATYLPDAPHASEVTLKQLLSHTSGLPDYLNGPEPDAELDRLATRPATYPQLVARVQGRPLEFPPGTRWSYSNTGYLLLGRVIEVVTGERYRDYLQRRILGPLGMRHTFTHADATRPTGMAVGYRHVKGTLETAPDLHPDWSGAAGFLISTLDDLGRWDRGLQDGRVVAPEDYRLMGSEVATSDGEGTGYGLGLFVDSAFDQPRIGHTGGAQGFTTADEYFPSQGLRIVVLTNSGDKNPEAGEALTNIAFARLRPALIAKADTPAANEPAHVNDLARSSFRELQRGADYQSFTARLREKLKDTAGKTFAERYADYGDMAHAVFKGTDLRNGQSWYRYVLVFSPGIRIGYDIRTEDGHVAGVTFH